jgi:hypothetical protein
VKDIYTPIVAYNLEQPLVSSSKLEDKCLIRFIIHNSSKFPVTCWCNVTVTVYGQPVPMDGFYGKKSPWNVQPQLFAKGYFNIEDIVKKAHRTLEQMSKDSFNVSNPKEQLQFKIEFWHCPNDKPKDIVTIPSESYYFDFKRGVLSMDF